ncbi:B12 binding domain protein [Planctomycetes bacterium Poly30]|uniref:B12 binding domain protein n=1 Tax=Saltatorellus ferox TaxID=2528018 RepID=A0A518ENK4_9BACT|nr:B12 binding domain protein [Planctomycetes bacterium Poly30]
MIQRKKRIVLFMPHRADPDEGVRVAADLLPLELLQIAAWPVEEGYEVVIIDAMVHDDYMKRIMEACDGALLYASSCILGFQVAHGARVAKAVRQKFPDLPIIWGGWFPSVAPELYFQEGIADAVGLGQGELTFRDVVHAIDAGEDLEKVPGLVIEKEGKILYTEHRPVVGFDKFPDAPWHLIDFEQYVERQQNAGPWKMRHKYPDPWDMPAGTPVRGFSYFSSFGCPEPCTFCCSPMVTGRRWKAIGGKDLAERLLELHDRFNFNVMRFQDANFGVAEKRSNEFTDTLIEAGSPFWWSGCYEIETIARYKKESLDKLQQSKCHMVSLGAEAGSEEQQAVIKKNIDTDHFETSLKAMYDRGITTGCSWIIGYPGETEESMFATIKRAAEMKLKFPRAASDVFPFRPIPGTEDFDKAVRLGYQAPRTLEEWGGCLEYREEFDDIQIPEDVLRTWKRYGVASTFYDGLAMEGAEWFRAVLKKVSAWRLKSGRYGFPIEHKAFHAYVKLTKQTRADKLGKAAHEVMHPGIDQTAGVTTSAPVYSRPSA